jgi:DNA-binding GntR family transcriptional regulator
MDHASEPARMRSSDQESQRDLAYHEIRRLLILQQIGEGERLREAAWAGRLGVNRTALREAFARLEAEGLIERGLRTGYALPILTDAAIQEIMEVRIMLEGGAIDRIIRRERNTRAHLRPLFETCDELERLVMEAYHAGVAEVDRRFHEGLIRACGNKRLFFLYNRAPLPIIHPVVVSGRPWAETVSRTLGEHRSILSNILAGDADEARQQLRAHLMDRHLLPAGTA